MPDHNDRPTAPLLYAGPRLHTPGPDGLPLCGSDHVEVYGAVPVAPGVRWPANACRDCAHHAAAILAQPAPAPAPPTRAQIDGAIWSAIHTWAAEHNSQPTDTAIDSMAHTVTDAVMALITPETR